MKIDKHMTVVVGGRVYNAPGITRIEVKGTDFEMDYDWGRYTLKCNTSDVELFTDKPSMADVLLPDETGYMPPLTTRIDVEETRLWNLCDGEYVSKKINCCLEDIKEALSEAIETLKDEQNCDIKLEINGEQFAKLIKKYNKLPTGEFASDDKYTVKAPEEVVRKAFDEAMEEAGSLPQRKTKTHSNGFFDSIAKSIENDNEVQETVKQAVREAIKECEVDQSRKAKIFWW